MPRQLPRAMVAAGLSLAASWSAAQNQPEPVADTAPTQLGPHALTRERGMVVDNGLSLGVGGHAPVLKGEYGGFMTFDASAHLQRPIHGRWFGAAGVAIGGGGGGKSAEQSKVLSGTGGYVKGYVGWVTRSTTSPSA